MLAAVAITTLLAVASASEVWPMPVNFTQGSTPVALSPADFTFQCTGLCPPVVSAAFIRYQDLVFVGTISKKRWTVTQKSADMPVLLGINFTVAGSVPVDFAVDESYTLQVPAAGGYAVVTSANEWGALRALETFSQLVQWQPSNTQPYQILNAGIEISDAPRFKWRGVLLDTSRHYLSVSTILSALDAMSYNKFNVLHWHVVDDQSWPIVSTQYPKFSQVGSYTPDTIYTQEDVTAIVQYAEARGIIVIPEFEGPAHAAIWGAAYPEYVVSCSDGETLLDPTGPVYPVFDGLLTEFGQAFTHGFIHIGGDEVNDMNCWQESATVQAFMKQMNFTTLFEVRDYYETQIQNIVAKHAKRAIVWEEVFDKGFTLAPSTIVNVWLSEAETATVAEAGFDVIHSQGWYLDQQTPCQQTFYFWEDTWQCFYLLDPLLNTTLTPAQQLHVLGGEASQWAEQVDDTNIEGRMWPRACATAERLWSVASLRDTGAAEGRLEHQRCRMAQRGIRAGPLRPASVYGYCNMP